MAAPFPRRLLAAAILLNSLHFRGAYSQTEAPSDTPRSRYQSIDLGDGVKLELVRIPAGSFQMGSPEKYAEMNETPSHKVTITKPFYLGKYEVTQQQWRAVMEHKPIPSRFLSPKRPLDSISWNDCQDFIKKLQNKIKSPRLKFALPTEAQWEYACRAGSKTKYVFGDESHPNFHKLISAYAWHSGNSRQSTHDVGTKKPNSWGLHDMYGNVWEWCADWYENSYRYSAAAQEDPVGPSSSAGLSGARVIRGSSFQFLPGNLDAMSSTNRLACNPDQGPGMGDIGFRLAAAILD